jgi:DNA repair ATPase RecN
MSTSTQPEALRRAPQLMTVEGIDRELGTQRRPVAAPAATPPLPDYVQHREDINRVGKLTAEAVVREYEAAVKEVEALGTELQDAAKRCEAMVAGVHAMVAEIKEIASRYRDEAKHYFVQIEACSVMTTEVRETCEALKKKISEMTALKTTA